MPYGYRVATLLIALISSSATNGRESAPVYKRADASLERRVEDLLARMTLEEKVAQLQSNDASLQLANGEIDAALAQKTIGSGLGTFIVPSIRTLAAAELAARQNAIQRWVLENTRLGIPIMFHGEALHGVSIGGATSFPQAIALGSTWDPALIRQTFAFVGQEARAAGISLVLSPVLDLARDPRYGRVEEMYSEDPYLVGEIGVAAIQGLQAGDQVIATAKHFVHGQPENGTNLGPSDFSERTMRAVFLAPFEKAVKIGRIGAVMPSYNEISGGVPASANSWLLNDVLRGEWGFKGVTVSDYFAVRMLQRQYQLADSAASGGVLAFNSGVDMELPAPNSFPGLVDAVKSGDVSQANLDAAVARVLMAKFRLGLFERPFTDIKKISAVVGARAHVDLARKVADKAIVLLKNEGNLLPLDPGKIRSLAVIGPNADKIRLGTYSGTPPYFVTVLQGIRKRLGDSARVMYAEGVRISEPDESPQLNYKAPYKEPSLENDTRLIAEAVTTAKSANVVVLVLGDNEAVTRETLGGSVGALGDTDTLELPGRQNELIREIMKLGKPTIAVLLNGRPFSPVELNCAVPAIIEGWYLGQETGNAIAGVLFGDVNPSGRLPVTIARNVGQLPVYYYRQPMSRLGYVFNSNEPLFPFGYGLSYAQFRYAKPSLDRPEIARGEAARLVVSVTNVGTRAGDEVVQLYVRPKFGSVVQPVARLAGFRRVNVAPGATVDVALDVGPVQLTVLDRNMKPDVEPGTVDVMVGPNAAQLETLELRVR